MQKNQLLLSLIFASSFGQAANLQEIKKADLLRVGVWEVSPPYGFVALDGDSYGFEVEIAKKIAKDLLGDENKVDFILVNTSEERIELLQNDKVDLVLAGFSVTPEREKLIDFSKPYLKTQLGIISHKESPITEIKQLKDNELTVTTDTPAEDYFVKHYPNLKLDRHEQDPESYKTFRDKKSKALVDDNVLLYPWVKESPNLYTIGIDKIGDVDYIAIGIQKGNKDLLKFVNSEIDQFKKDGTFQSAWGKYLQPAYGDTIQPADVLILD